MQHNIAKHYAFAVTENTDRLKIRTERTSRRRTVVNERTKATYVSVMAAARVPRQFAPVHYYTRTAWPTLVNTRYQIIPNVVLCGTQGTNTAVPLRIDEKYMCGLQGPCWSHSWYTATTVLSLQMSCPPPKPKGRRRANDGWTIENAWVFFFSFFSS